MALNLIFLGPPGAGKGTVAQAIANDYKLIQVSTGDMIREEVASGSEFGKKLSIIINAGQLVDDNTMAELLEKKLSTLVASPSFSGFILDGFPRTTPQADALEGILLKLNQKLSAVIYIESSEESIVKRLSSRRTCPTCKKVYNTLTIPPKVQGVCDIDGAPLIQRDDDKPETIRKRFKVFLETTMPLIDYYKAKDLLKQYDGNVPPEPSIARAREIIEGLVK